MLRIRPASPADLDQMWQIEAVVFAGEAWSRELMRDELTAEHRSYVALVADDGAVLGYGGALILGTEADIQTIAVDPSARGAGHGRALMNTLLDKAASRGVRDIFLEVRADNPVAQNLYASLGFEQIGVRPNYYQPDNVDAIVMKCEMRNRK